MKQSAERMDRTPMPEHVDHDIKRTLGRTPVHLTPVSVHGNHLGLEEHHRAYMRERLGQRLGKFAYAIERICVYVEDVNGIKGGNDIECRIQVTLSKLGLVVAKGSHADLISSFDLASDAIDAALRHRIGKVRDQSVHERRRAEERRRTALPT